MELQIKNFAVIKEANIRFDGITVIAGENNTGKSTVGKVLFALFYSFYHMEAKLWANRWAALADRIARLINGADDVSEQYVSFNGMRRLTNYLLRTLPNEHPVDEQKCLAAIQTFLQQDNVDAQIIHSLKEELLKEIRNVNHYNNSQIQNTILTNTFRKVFSGQSNSRLHDLPADIFLHIKKNDITVQIRQEKCVKSVSPIVFQHSATYIENPFIMDELTRNPFLPGKSVLTRELIKKLKNEHSDEYSMDALAQQMWEDELRDVIERIQSVMHGSFVDKDGSLFLHQEGMHGDIFVNNLSTGLKAFAVLKRLLELRKLNEQDVLILDEPEIHLHPAWQLVYAELIVLLQKAFNLTILLTTHSPYFLEAIEVFSEKYDLQDKTRFYLANMQNGKATFDDVTDDTARIYQLLAEPFDKLDELRRGKGRC